MRRENIFTSKEKEIIDTLLIYNILEESKSVNPSFLEKHMYGRITRPGARYACDHLVKLGFLSTVSKRPLTRVECSTHYYLNSSTESFVQLAKRYFATLMVTDRISWSASTYIFRNSRYVQEHITPSFVRNILAQKSVEMRLMVFLDDIDQVKFDGSKRYPAESKYYCLRLPVSIGVPPIEEVSKLNLKTWNFDEKIVKELISKYYSEAEEKRLILPILALLKLSPSALDYFLGDWKVYETDTIFFSSGSQGYAMIEHVLFRLIWASIWDLSFSRLTAEHAGIVSASVMPEHTFRTDRNPPLLLINLENRQIIGYEAGFDTNHDYAGDESGNIYEIERNPENCWIKIWVDNQKLDWQLKKYNVYVDATISGRHDKHLPKKAHIAYVVDGLELNNFKEINEYQSDKAELSAILFALNELEEKLKRFDIFCDHEGNVSDINLKEIKSKKKSPILIEIRDRLQKNPSIKVKHFLINPAHTYVKKRLNDIKLNPE